MPAHLLVRDTWEAARDRRTLRYPARTARDCYVSTRPSYSWEYSLRQFWRRELNLRLRFRTEILPVVVVSVPDFVARNLRPPHSNGTNARVGCEFGDRFIRTTCEATTTVASRKFDKFEVPSGAERRQYLGRYDHNADWKRDDVLATQSEGATARIDRRTRQVQLLMQ